MVKAAENSWMGVRGKEVLLWYSTLSNVSRCEAQGRNSARFMKRVACKADIRRGCVCLYAVHSTRVSLRGYFSCGCGHYHCSGTIKAYRPECNSGACEAKINIIKA